MNLPATEFDFVSAQMDVRIGEHLKDFEEEILKEGVVSIRNRVDRAVVARGFSGRVVAFGEQSGHAGSPRPRVARRVAFRKHSDTSQATVLVDFSDIRLRVDVAVLVERSQAAVMEKHQIKTNSKPL